MENMVPVIISLKLAVVTTIVLFVTAMPVAYWLTFTRVRFKIFWETVLNTPMVLPPSVLGFYLLCLFSPDGMLGGFLENVTGVRVVFSFSGLVIGCAIFSFPYMMNTLRTGFEDVPYSLIESSYSLGKGRVRTFFSVILPNARGSAVNAAGMVFTRTIGAFGVVLMMGGNIPGLTRAASIAIYNEMESMNHSAANFYSLVIILITMLILSILFSYNKKRGKGAVT